MKGGTYLFHREKGKDENLGLSPKQRGKQILILRNLQDNLI